MIISSCGCDQSHSLIADAAVASRRDPTGTGAVRRRYEREMVRRFTELKKLVRYALVELDVLGLQKRPDPLSAMNAQLFASAFGQQRIAASRTGDATPPPAPRAFQFERNAGKVSGFMDWLYQAEREGIVGVIQGTPLRSASQQSWQNVYIDSAYQKGMRDAGAKIAGSSASAIGGFNDPVHAERVGLIYTRAYRDLEGITDAMDQQISRVLARGLAEGRGVRQMAREIADRIDAIGIVRARTLARTEIINAHAEATLTSYEEAGLEGVKVLAEFSTSQDDAVCPECEELEGQEFTIEEARGMIPVHPNCRCAYLPVVAD